MKPLTKTVVADTFIDILRAELGVKETESNTGARIREYQASTTLGGTGWPWCDALMSWGIRETEKRLDIEIPWVHTASCDVTLADLRGRGLLRGAPQKGDVFLVRARKRDGTFSKTDAVHIGGVEDVSSVFSTIEGNTNNTGGREGVAVMRHKREVSSRFYFGRWIDALPAFEAAPVAVPYSAFYQQGASSTKPLTVQMHNGSVYVAARDFAGAMGRDIRWAANNGVVLIGGEEVGLMPRLFGGRAFFGIRDLAEFYGLKLSVDGAARRVEVTR